jgi:prepilin-type N-terminal cleavage/methylation domain-containing protein
MKRTHKQNLVERAAKKRGFSLAELSIVIAIISVVMGSAISVVVTQDDNLRLSQTEKKIERIQEALVAFLVLNHRLPCPADASLALEHANFGAALPELVADANVDSCTSATHTYTTENLYFGMVPVTTLGISNAYAIDGWDRRFMYVVDRKAINNISTYSACDSSNRDCFVHMSGGVIDIKAVGEASIESAAVVALISFGENGHGAYGKNGGARYNAYQASGATVDTHERENSFLSAAGATDSQPTNLNDVIIRKDRTATFDDIVWYATKQQLVREAGAGYDGSECVIAKAVEDNDPDDCTGASGTIDAATCRSFATEIWSRCLQ